MVTAQNHNLTLDQAKDSIVKLTPGGDRVPSALSIRGGHNVVIDGGDLDVTGPSGGLALKNQTGTVWIHNLHVSGANLIDGIDLREPVPGVTVVLRDVLVDDVHGGSAINHAALLHTWAGPSRLLIDGFHGTTEDQGFFLHPYQSLTGPAPRIVDLRNVQIDDNGGYALRREGGGWPLNIENVFVRPSLAEVDRDSWLWPEPSTGDTTWSRVGAGTPPNGDDVVATGTGASGVDDTLAPVALPSEF